MKKLKKIEENFNNSISKRGLLMGLAETFLYYWGDVVALCQRFVGKCFVRVDKNRIAFVSTPDYSDNARALYEYVRGAAPEKKLIWFVSDPDREEKRIGVGARCLPKERIHNHYRWRTMLAAYSCGQIFYTHNSPLYRDHKKEGQFIINLWHGCGYKDTEREKTARLNIKFDYALVPGELFVQTKAAFFCAKAETILPIGYPRYDLFLRSSAAAEDYARWLKAGEGDRLVIWMPTLRNSGTEEFPESAVYGASDFPLCTDTSDLVTVDRICARMGVTVCVKRHPMQIAYTAERLRLEHIRFIGNDDLERADIQLYELLPYTDALISDYSSIAVDYLLLDRPIAFALDDFEKYRAARGFVFDDPLAYMPGHHLYGTDDLKTFLGDVSTGSDPYREQRQAMMDIMQNPCENYCKRIWETIQNLASADLENDRRA